jgi:hypothetical protein
VKGDAGMGLTKIAFQALEDSVGPENITDDAAVMEAYAKNPWPWGILGKRRPDAVVLPKSVAEIQSIYRLCNRYGFGAIPAGNYNWDVPLQDNVIVIDPKRMDKVIEINTKSMYALVEPAVTHAQLSTEIMKKGLYCNCTFAGGPSSVVANNTFAGMGGANYRAGLDRVNLALEWVLPSGEILNVGSAGITGAGYFWPEGPGPDFRGLLRGFFGVLGGFGMVTKLAVKLFHWPGPRTFDCTGTSGKYRVEFPPERFRAHMVRYPTREQMIEGMYEIGKAEIGAAMQYFTPYMICFLATPSKEEFWEKWEEGLFQKYASNLITLWLVGYSSQAQLEYEEKVLQQIIEETGGEDVRAEDELSKLVDPALVAPEFFRCGISGRIMRPVGTHFIAIIGDDSLDHALKLAKTGDEVRKDFASYFMDDGDSDWINCHDFAWHADSECLIYPEITEEGMVKAGELAQAGIKKCIERKIYSVLQATDTNPVLGPVYGNYHELLKKIKKFMDPNNIANPPNPIRVEQIENSDKTP